MKRKTMDGIELPNQKCTRIFGEKEILQVPGNSESGQHKRNRNEGKSKKGVS